MSFNPLFIHSAAGLGKTHLLNAIAWRIRQRHNERRVLYITAERFMYHFIGALRQRDTISFNIPGTGVHTISPTSALPGISDAVIIDGYTQPGASLNTLAQSDNAVLLIELSGAALTDALAAIGLYLQANNCTVRWLVINRFALEDRGGGAIWRTSLASAHRTRCR